MQAPRFSGIVRVTNTRDEIETATQLGLEKKREGYSPEALVLAIDEVVHNLQLARAIVVYIQSAASRENEPPVERPFSWFLVLASAGFAVTCLWLIVVLFGLVDPSTGFWTVLGIVLGQAILFRTARRGFRLAFMAACDGLNDASYPTNLHPLRHATSAIGTIRLRRLRALVVETSDRIASGATKAGLVEELSEINLTPRAAKFVVTLAAWNGVIRDFVPPYQSRWLGYALAFAFMAAAVISIQRLGDRLAEGYQNYALCLTVWIAGDLAARPRRRLPGPPENPV